MEIAVHGQAVPARHAAARAADAVAVPLFATAMFASGFLLFVVEPMIARMVLPVLGGVPMVWNGCVVFFQIVMLAGYGYAFAAARWLSLRRHVPLHVALLVLAALVLPIRILAGTPAPPAGNPLGWLLLVLAATIGLPFFALSTTASVLQHWLSRSDHRAGRDPYFLYASSNAGCLLALAAYPALIERSLSLGEQARLWAAGYAGFAALAAACGVYAWRRESASSGAPAVAATLEAAPAVARRVRWIALAFVPSSLMLAVTTYVSTDLAAIPLLWIVPLAIYLATFAVAFGRRGGAAGAAAWRAVPLLAVPLALVMIARVREPLLPILLLHLGAFAAVALYCHTDLAADRPGPAHLTGFYFWLSLGGMLGGLFNTLAAPLLFDSVTEYPLVVALACLLRRAPDTATRGRRDGVTAIAVAAGTAAVMLATRWLHLPLAVQLPLLGGAAVIAFTRRRERDFGWALAALLAAGIGLADSDGRVLHATRTFFGVYRVNEDASHRYHGLAHGTTLHGVQALAPERRREALTYYHSTGPFGEAWRALPGARGREIAAVGLGVGTLATYAGPQQRWTFFEIDPAIETIAREAAYFTFLETCGARCRVLVGDARLSLGRADSPRFDLIVLDAFSSDSIPVHLVTREAFDLYLSRLAPRGSILLHVSNRHLRLAPIVGRLAADRGLYAARRTDTAAGRPEGKSASDWIAIARDPRDIAPLIVNNAWTPLAASPATPLWTDDFSNVLAVLEWR